MSYLKPLPLVALLFGFSWFPWSSDDSDNTKEGSNTTGGVSLELSKVIEPPAPELFHQKLPLNIDLTVEAGTQID